MGLSDLEQKEENARSPSAPGLPGSTSGRKDWLAKATPCRFVKRRHRGHVSTATAQRQRQWCPIQHGSGQGIYLTLVDVDLSHPELLLVRLPSQEDSAFSADGVRFYDGQCPLGAEDLSLAAPSSAKAAIEDSQHAALVAQQPGKGLVHATLSESLPAKDLLRLPRHRRTKLMG